MPVDASLSRVIVVPVGKLKLDKLYVGDKLDLKVEPAPTAASTLIVSNPCVDATKPDFEDPKKLKLVTAFGDIGKLTKFC
jgi:hypothetical protein